MKQRLGIAMALLSDPELIILDEPTNGLDPMGIIEMRELLKKVNKEDGVTIVISSHLLSELYQLVSCYGILHNGRIIEEMTKAELDEKCKKAIELKVDQTEKAVWVLETILGINQFQVYPNGSIKIYQFVDKPELISQALAQEGIVIKQIVIKGDELETYYMNRVGGLEND